VADKKKPGPRQESLNLNKADDTIAPDTYEALAEATSKRGLFGRVNSRFQDALQTGRGDNRRAHARQESRDNPHVTTDDLALRRARNVSTQRMIIPEGVIIEGSLTSGSETDINGHIDGDVTVEGFLNLGGSALIAGNVRARRCTIEGAVDGKMDCAEEIVLAQSGRLNSDVIAGKQLTIAGEINGNVQCSGLLRLEATGKVTGNIRARKMIIEEGAVLNGKCSMRPPAERSKK